jgi:hypothetical protein
MNRALRRFGQRLFAVAAAAGALTGWAEAHRSLRASGRAPRWSAGNPLQCPIS